MSSSRSLAEIEGFIRDMRELGAASVRVGDIAVVFDLPLVAQLEPPAEMTPEEAASEAKRHADRLLYGSSE